MEAITKMYDLLLDKVVGQISNRYDNESEEQGSLIMMCHMQATMRPLVDEVKARIGGQQAEIAELKLKAESYKEQLAEARDTISRRNKQIADLKWEEANCKVSK